jgi:hypothetical protein
MSAVPALQTFVLVPLAKSRSTPEEIETYIDAFVSIAFSGLLRSQDSFIKQQFQANLKDVDLNAPRTKSEFNFLQSRLRSRYEAISRQHLDTVDHFFINVLKQPSTYTGRSSFPTLDTAQSKHSLVKYLVDYTLDSRGKSFTDFQRIQFEAHQDLDTLTARLGSFAQIFWALMDPTQVGIYPQNFVEIFARVIFSEEELKSKCDEIVRHCKTDLNKSRTGVESLVEQFLDRRQCMLDDDDILHLTTPLKDALKIVYLPPRKSIESKNPAYSALAQRDKERLNRSRNGTDTPSELLLERLLALVSPQKSGYNGYSQETQPQPDPTAPPSAVSEPSREGAPPAQVADVPKSDKAQVKDPAPQDASSLPSVDSNAVSGGTPAKSTTAAETTPVEQKVPKPDVRPLEIDDAAFERAYALYETMRELARPTHTELTELRSAVSTCWIQEFCAETRKRIAIGKLNVPQPVWFIGDIHGDLLSLALIKTAWEMENKPRVVFLGDLVDRGRHCYQLALGVMRWIRESEGSVGWIAGNHDVGLHWRENSGFMADIRPAEFCEWLEKLRSAGDHTEVIAFGQVFAEIAQELPRALFLQNGAGILASHGGFPASDVWDTIKSIDDLENHVGDFTNNRLSEGPKKFPNRHARGFQFGYKDFFAFRKKAEEIGLGFAYFVRGHDHPEDQQGRWERLESYENRVLTITSQLRNESVNRAPEPRWPTVASWEPSASDQWTLTPREIRFSPEVWTTKTDQEK